MKAAVYKSRSTSKDQKIRLISSEFILAKEVKSENYEGTSGIYNMYYTVVVDHCVRTGGGGTAAAGCCSFLLMRTYRGLSAHMVTPK